MEIDQAYQDKENEEKELENSWSALNELKTVKAERDKLASGKAALRTKLPTLLTSANASAAGLGLGVDKTDHYEQDLLGVIGRLKENCAQRDGISIDISILTRHFQLLNYFQMKLKHSAQISSNHSITAGS